jgi:hypothetical protein
VWPSQRRFGGGRGEDGGRLPGLAQQRRGQGEGWPQRRTAQTRNMRTGSAVNAACPVPARQSVRRAASAERGQAAVLWAALCIDPCPRGADW